jgi:N-acyl-D-amino-acid deacylase
VSFEISLKNGAIVDGTGNPWFKSDVGIEGGRIAEISPTGIRSAERCIDAKGLVVAPGFIDVHNHSDYSVLVHNRAESVLASGITTQGVGNCGGSVFPVTDKYRRSLEATLSEFGSSLKVNWATLSDWREKVETKAIGANLAPYVGHNTVRSCVMGEEGDGGERYEPTQDEMEEMKTHVDQAMRDGAFGLSSGLPFPPGRNALTQELVELCEVVARYGGFYTSHMRDTTDHSIEAAAEFIEICEKSGVRGFMSHLYSGFSWNHGKPIAILRLIDEARARGVDVTFDVVPFAPMIDGCFLGRAPTRTLEHKPISRTQLLEEWKDIDKWNKFKKEALATVNKHRQNAKERGMQLEKRGQRFGFSEREIHLVNQLKLMIGHSKTRPDLQGKNLAESARIMGCPDYMEFVRELFLADDGVTTCGGNDVSEEDVIAMIRHPVAMLSTDTWQHDFSNVPWSVMVEKLEWFFVHSWAFAYTFERYVRDKNILTLAEAIRKMTSLPARTLNLKDRGTITRGNFADIVVFDPDRIRSNATYANPTLYPSGILYVIVNGVLVVDNGRHTGALPGKVLVHET